MEIHSTSSHIVVPAHAVIRSYEGDLYHSSKMEGSVLFEMDLLYAVQYIPRNMHTVFALLCFVVVIHWLIFPYPSGLLHWHCGNLTIAPVPAKQPWWIWINTSCDFIMNDCITTTKQSTTKPCAYFLGYTVNRYWSWTSMTGFVKSRMFYDETKIHCIVVPSLESKDKIMIINTIFALSLQYISTRIMSLPIVFSGYTCHQAY